MGADRSQNLASELKLQMDLSVISNMVFYRDPSNSCGWVLCALTLLLAKPHGPQFSTRTSTPSLKLSSRSDPCVTSEVKQSSQTAWLLLGPSSRTCFRACSLSTVIILGFAPTRSINKTFWYCYVCPIISHRLVTELVSWEFVYPAKEMFKKLPQKSRRGLKLLLQGNSLFSSFTVKEQCIFLQASINSANVT